MGHPSFGDYSARTADLEGPLHVFERTPAGWAVAPTDGPRFFDGSDVEISNGTILVSDCCWSAGVVRKNELGVWTRSARVVGGSPATSDDEDKGGDVDISGDAFIVANHSLEPFAFPDGPEARIYERAGDAWLETARLRGFGTVDDVVRSVAIDAGTAYVRGSAFTDVRVFDRNAAGEWLNTRIIAPVDTHLQAAHTLDTTNLRRWSAVLDGCPIAQALNGSGAP